MQDVCHVYDTLEAIVQDVCHVYDTLEAIVQEVCHVYDTLEAIVQDVCHVYDTFEAIAQDACIGVNLPDSGGIVPLLGYSSRCPTLHLICHALCSDTLISRTYRVKYAYSSSMA